MIKLNNLSVGYSDKAVLSNINLTFEDGLIYGILAKSGIGKTTLLKTIAGLLRPLCGEVLIDGATYQKAERNPVYMMHQQYSNFDWLSCIDNILIAQRDKSLRDQKDAMKALAAVGLGEYAKKWPSRSRMQRLIMAVHFTTKNTIIMVTHSQDEAIKMCDKIIEFDMKGVTSYEPA